MKIALAGNPNSGKTTLFNAITGKTEYVGNWPGVTVDKKEANLSRKFKKIIQDARIVDLPGAYSIAPYTNEEAITSDFVTGENPQVLINIIDASSLERSLYFTSQLMELGVPMVLALNKQDIVKRQGTIIDENILSDLLGCPVIPTRANTGEGLKELIQEVKATAGKKTQKALEFAGKGSEDEDSARLKAVKQITKKAIVKKKDPSEITLSDKVDRIVANPILGLPIFAIIMWVVYSLAINGIGGYFSGYLNDTLFGAIIPDSLNSFFESINLNPLLQALIVDGIVAGVGAVLGFVPLIMVLFFLLGLLEDSGYMARVAVIMDRYFKKIGLSGKSIIPMIVGTGCSIPGIMSTRTIEDDNERRMTTMLTPFVPCSAKLPIIALFLGVFYEGKAWMLPAMYFLAAFMIIAGGLILKKIFRWESNSSFIMELPEYKVPSLKHGFRQMYHQAMAFIKKAATIILVMNALVWFMQTYSWNLQVVEDQSASILAAVGTVIAPILLPLGIVGWQLAAAAITGFVAKENVVSTFAIVLAATSEQALGMPGSVLADFFNPVTGLAFIAFNLFTPPCFAAMGAMNSEFTEKKWLRRTILFQLCVGYTSAILISQIGTLIVYHHLATGFIPAVVIVAFMIGLVIYLSKRASSPQIGSRKGVLSE